MHWRPLSASDWQVQPWLFRSRRTHKTGALPGGWSDSMVFDGFCTRGCKESKGLKPTVSNWIGYSYSIQCNYPLFFHLFPSQLTVHYICMNGSIPSCSASSSHVGSAAAPESRASRWLAWAPNLQFAEKGQPFLCVRMVVSQIMFSYVFSLWPDEFFKFQSSHRGSSCRWQRHVVSYLWLFSCA